MYQNNQIFRQTQQDSVASMSAASMSDHVTVIVEMPVRLEGRMVSSRAMMIPLLWQEYGLDVLNPVLSRWLERKAPDIKHAVARNYSESSGLIVGPDGLLKVTLSRRLDRRLRELSSQYLDWQMEMEQSQPKANPSQRLDRRQREVPSQQYMRMQREPEMEQTEPIVNPSQRLDRRLREVSSQSMGWQRETKVYSNKRSVNQNIDCYKVA
jgi:hypothetical protein